MAFKRKYPFQDYNVYDEKEVSIINENIMDIEYEELDIDESDWVTEITEEPD